MKTTLPKLNLIDTEQFQAASIWTKSFNKFDDPYSYDVPKDYSGEMGRLTQMTKFLQEFFASEFETNVERQDINEGRWQYYYGKECWLIYRFLGDIEKDGKVTAKGKDANDIASTNWLEHVLEIISPSFRYCTDKEGRIACSMITDLWTSGVEGYTYST